LERNAIFNIVVNISFKKTTEKDTKEKEKRIILIY